MPFSKILSDLKIMTKLGRRNDDYREYMIEDEEMSKMKQNSGRLKSPKIKERFQSMHKSCKNLASKTHCEIEIEPSVVIDKLATVKHLVSPRTHRKIIKNPSNMRFHTISTPKLFRSFKVLRRSQNSEYSDRKPFT